MRAQTAWTHTPRRWLLAVMLMVAATGSLRATDDSPATADGDLPPASLRQAIALMLSTRRFCSDPFDKTAQPVIDTPVGDALRSDEDSLVTRVDGKEVTTVWKGMTPATFCGIAEQLLPQMDAKSHDTLLVYALSHQQLQVAREMFDQLKTQCDKEQITLQQDQQKMMQTGRWDQSASDSYQQRWMELQQMQQILARRGNTLRQLEALAANGGLVSDSSKPRTVDNVETAFTDPGLISIPVAFDAGVQAGKKKDENLGKAGILEVKNYEDTDEWGWVLQRVYLRFHIQQLRGQKITGVYLATYGNLGDGDKPVTVDLRGLAADQVNWREDKLTWNTQPDVKGDPVGQLIFTYGNTLKRATEGRWYISGNLKPWLQKELDANHWNVGLQLTTTIKEEACLFTKEHPNGKKTAPRLIVTVEPAADETILDDLNR